MQNLIGISQGLDCGFSNRVGCFEVCFVWCSFVQLDEAAKYDTLVVGPTGMNMVSFD